jgi:hypothetical protein
MKKDMAGLFRLRCNNCTANAKSGDVSRNIKGKYCANISNILLQMLDRRSNPNNLSTIAFFSEKEYIP